MLGFNKRWWEVPGQKIWEDLPGTCAGEREEIFNGAFRDNADGWDVGVGWSYQPGAMKHTPGSQGSLRQFGTMVDGGFYRKGLTITGTVGTVSIRIDDDNNIEFAAGSGNVFDLNTTEIDIGTKVVIIPSSDFDGTVSNISVRKLDSDCD